MLSVKDACARCWAEVDLDAVTANYDVASRLLGGTKIMPVLKANAYGLGAVPIAKRLSEKGASLFAVATTPEALELLHGARVGTLVLGFSGSGAQTRQAVSEGVRLTVYSLEQAREISRAAIECGRDAIVHIKLDTGLHRIGIEAGDGAPKILRQIVALPRIRAEGLYTHLALRDKAGDERQHDACVRVEEAACRLGVEIPIYHMIDSIGMLRHPEWKLDMARIGAWLYGVAPRDLLDKSLCRLPVSFKSRVVQVRRVAKGEYIGYDEEHPLQRDSLVATLSAGYADGYPRSDNRGDVLVRGMRARVLGLVCMDQMMIDVTDVPGAAAGDVATLLGGDIGVDEYAAYTGINRNDALSRIGRRVPRVYMQNGEVVEIADFS